MKNLFSIGEVAKQQNISRQTLLFYDKIGLFCPVWVDPQNGYRYYSASQLDYLDTICIMKKIGFSLEEIKAHMQGYTIEHSIEALHRQLAVVEGKIAELQMIKSRAEHRCRELEQVATLRKNSRNVTVEDQPARCLLLQKVEPPFSLEDVSLATKRCFVRSFKDQLPIYYQSGAIVPLHRVLQQRYTEAEYAFLPIEGAGAAHDVLQLPAGRCVCTYHIGNYSAVAGAYRRLLDYCRANGLTIVSDSYEFAINDYLSTGDESEYITKIMFYVQGGKEQENTK